LFNGGPNKPLLSLSFGPKTTGRTPDGNERLT
jgi:hypothetical protein